MDYALIETGKNPCEEQTMNWFTIDELAKWSGLTVETLKGGHSPLQELSIDINTDTRLGGYHNTQKFYSENVLIALKKYQMRNAAPNALKDKQTAISGNASMTVNATIDTLLDNPATVQLLLQKSLERNTRLGLENKQLREIIEEQKPKVESYDNVLASTNLTEIGTVGKITGIGERKMFSRLSDDKVIYRKCDSDGVSYYVPYYGFDKFFKVVPEPFLRGDKKLVRNKLMFTQAGVIWATSKYRKTA